MILEASRQRELALGPRPYTAEIPELAIHWASVRRRGKNVDSSSMSNPLRRRGKNYDAST